MKTAAGLKDSEVRSTNPLEHPFQTNAGDERRWRHGRGVRRWIGTGAAGGPQNHDGAADETLTRQDAPLARVERIAAVVAEDEVAVGRNDLRGDRAAGCRFGQIRLREGQDAARRPAGFGAGGDAPPCHDSRYHNILRWLRGG